MDISIPSNGAPSPTPRAATGKMVVDIARHHDYSYDSALQPDGKILLVGHGYNPGSNSDDFSVIRLNADGTLDTGFSGDGKAIVDIGGGYDQGLSLAVLPDGKLLLSGNHNGDFSVIRLNADGSLDTGFGSDGKAIVDIRGSNDQGLGLTVLPDGKLLVAGQSHNSGSHSYDYDFSVIRLNADGSLDTSFGSDGKATFDIAGAGRNLVHSMTVQPDGKILLAGISSYTLEVIRLNADGTLDTGFGSDGKATFDLGWSDDQGYSLTVQPDGKILLAGSSYDYAYDSPENSTYFDFSVIRLNADGTLDTGFGSDGEATVDINGDTDQGYSLSVQPDGRILVAGRSYNPNYDTEFSVARLNADGSLDINFDSDGKASFNLGNGYAQVNSLALQPDGKILLAGHSYNSNSASYDFSVIRLNADGSLDKTFGALDDGVVILEGSDDNDVLIGNNAPELILGEGGEDRLEGSAGNDILDGGAGRDSLSGGAGADLFRVSSREDSYRTASEGSTDRILDFDPGEDRIDLSALGFTGLGDGHGGTLAVRVNSAGTHTYLKSFEADAEGRRFEISLKGNLAGQLDSGNLIFAPLVLEGTAAADRLTGSPLAEILTGGDGDDRLHGAGGDDLLDGGAGRDRLIGGSGADLFRIASRDHSYRTDSESFADRILDFDPGEDQLDLSALGFVGLGDGRDGTLAVRVNEAGTRTYLKSFEADAEGRRFEIVLDGDLAGRLDSGNLLFAPVALAGGAAGDRLIGSAAAESLAGGAGDDYLHGGAGGDSLDGGLGRDTLA
ncbi:M10 family metallopeptidase C-terminal domain-containing protein, partial [Azotobacter salinestris]